MKRTKTLLACLCGLVAMCASAVGKEWRGLVPLVSTRADVERLLGPPVQPCRLWACFYETEDSHVLVMYSSGPCLDDQSGSYNVPRDTVLSIDVTPKKKWLLSDLHVDLSRYEKYEDPEIPGIVYYKSADEGLFLQVQSGAIEEFSYFSRSRDDYLLCRPSKVKSLTRSGQPCPTVKIEGPLGVTKPGKPIILNAVAVGLKRNILPTYNWTVSAAAIAAGQGTSALTIDPGGLSPQTITITVQVVSFPEECRNVAAYTLKLGDTPRKDKPQSKGSRHRLRLARQP